ncbi:MAG: hypothetical protein PHG44_04255 [Lentisphaeria bacterium]|nr:hypothetical protein [Lentisphaeria bacterium]
MPKQNIDAYQARLEDIFKRDDIRGLWPSLLNSETCFLLAEVLLGMLLKRNLPARIVLGHDARLGSYDLSLAFMRAFAGKGGSCRFLGLVSSEQLYYAAGKYSNDFAAGVMITASHNPKEYNGIKFVHAGGVPFSADDLTELKEGLFAALKVPEELDLKREFAEHLLSLAQFDAVPMQGQKLRIVLAAGHGVGAVAFKPLADKLQKWGFEFSYMEPEPDGNFPKGVPNPLLEEHIKRLGKEVKSQEADLGIMFDGDADRAGFVDHKGKEIIPAHVYALVAQRKLRACKTKAPLLMRNLCSSQLLKELFEGGEQQVEVLDTPVGHGQIKMLMRDEKFRERVIFAGEHSGHYFYPEFYYLDSGFLTSLLLLAELKELQQNNKTMREQLKNWRRKYQWSGEINYDLPHKNAVYSALKELELHFDKLPNIQKLGVCKDKQSGLYGIAKLKEEYLPQKRSYPDLKMLRENEDGSGWWFVVRPSGNENKLRLNFEYWKLPKAQAEAIMDDIKDILKRNSATKA